MASNHTSPLFSCIRIGSVDIKNRLAVAPMTRISATDHGVPTDKMISYYQRFAKGDFGLIISEGTFIDKKNSQTYLQQPGIVSEDHVEGWKKLVDAVHNERAKIFMQIQHAGALSQGNPHATYNVAPSAVHPKGEQLGFYFGDGKYQIPKALTQTEIADIVNAFADAAERAKKAGVDGVEIHGANGYLLDQFLTTYANERIDEYGGSTLNRLRIYIEVIKAVRERVGENFVVGIRLSQGKVNDYFHKWEGVQEAELIFSSLNNVGLDYLHITEFQANVAAFPTETHGENLPLAAIAKRVSNLPVFANGQVETTDTALSIIRQGTADLLTIGKAALANPDFPRKLRDDQPLAALDPLAVLRPTAELKEFEYN